MTRVSVYGVVRSFRELAVLRQVWTCLSGSAHWVNRNNTGVPCSEVCGGFYLWQVGISFMKHGCIHTLGAVADTGMSESDTEV